MRQPDCGELRGGGNLKGVPPDFGGAYCSDYRMMSGVWGGFVSSEPRP
jgi:hypothetical protein